MGALLLAALLVSVAIASLWLARKWNPSLSESDLCRVAGHPTEETVVVLDATDPWNPIQRARVEQEFRNVQAGIPRYGRVTLYTVGTEFAGLPVPALRLCNPGDTTDFENFPLIGMGGVRVVANPEIVERRWSEGFVAKLDSVFGDQAAKPGSEQSPLLETIRGAAIAVFGSLDSKELPKRRIYIFSDLLQNSNLYSHYRDPKWNGTQGRALADLSVAGTTALNGVEAHLFLLDRDLHRGPGQTRSGLVEFWDAYLGAQGATVISVRRIER